MIKGCITMLVILFLLLSGSGFCAEKEEPKTPQQSIFWKEVPVVLTTKIDREMERISRKHPLSAKQTKEVEGIIRGFKREPEFEHLAPKEIKEERHRQQLRVHQLGIRAVPKIARMMLSQDDKIRKNAKDASANLLFDYPVRVVSGDKEVQDVLVLLYNRCLFDRNPDIRRGAATGLYTIGKRRFHDMPEGVKTGLEQVEKEDPVLGNRQVAHADRVRLGLTEWDPELLPDGVETE